MISLGGAIGVTLFLGSAKAIHAAGPVLLLAYALAGAVVYLVMRALGELLLSRLDSVSFTDQVGEQLGDGARFLTGWTYWFMWTVAGMLEITAVAHYVRYWAPGVPQWVAAAGALVLLGAANLAAVRFFGEVEFWFALVKVATIVVLISVAVLAVGVDLGPVSSQASLENLWAHGGFAPHGFGQLFLWLNVATASFFGVELLGMAARETQDPGRTLPAAIRGVLWRIGIFYLGALTAVMVLIPWDRLAADVSPFVQVFSLLGVESAAGVVNFVILTAALSTCNSGLFSTGRLLYSLSARGQAPARLGVLDRRGVPSRAVLATVAVMVVGVLVNYLAPQEAFFVIFGVAATAGLLTWIAIAAAHLRFRARGGGVPGFRMPGAPWTNVLVIAYLLLVIALMGVDSQTRVALFVTPVWLLGLLVAYRVIRRRSRL